jgi:hypothetical protein
MSESNHKAVSRGARATALLNDDLLTEAFANLEASYTEAWKTSSATKTAEREKLFVAVNVIRKVREHLLKTAANGKLAQKEIDALAAEADRKKLMGVFRRG